MKTLRTFELNIQYDRGELGITEVYDPIEYYHKDYLDINNARDVALAVEDFCEGLYRRDED